MAGPVPVATVLGCDPVSHRSCVVLVRGRAPSDTRIRGRNIHDYYFGEANTANKSDNHHNNAINENINWGGFPGCYSSLPPTVDLVPRSRTIPGGGGGGGGGGGESRGSERRRRTQHHQQRTRLHVDDELRTRNFRKKRQRQ